MNDINRIDIIFRHFERILRWGYPGVIFAVILYATKPAIVVDAVNDVGIWGLLI